MTELEKKIRQATKLLKAACGDDLTEVAYSGGKDSDVILQLAKEAGINYRAIYRNTTIDPPGTLRHVKDMGVEVLMPRNGENFFSLMRKHGMPGRKYRFCCEYLKEYKILDKSIIGVRKDESKAREERYSEPVSCRIYGNRENHVDVIYPILDWTYDDVRDFIIDRGIKCAPVYYDEEGNFHPERRLGCMCCPLASKRKRIAEFKKYPNMMKGYVRSADYYLRNHPSTKMSQRFDNAYQWMICNLLYDSSWVLFSRSADASYDEDTYREFLERHFKIKFK